MIFLFSPATAVRPGVVSLGSQHDAAGFSTFASVPATVLSGPCPCWRPYCWTILPVADILVAPLLLLALSAAAVGASLFPLFASLPLLALLLLSQQC